jgi:lariat debranching enzyme
VSGIYKGHDYLKGHFELPPYDEGSKRSVYHVRQLEIFRLKQISRPLNIFLSHDWPVGVTDFGDKNMLLRFKPYFQEDIERGVLGSPCTWDLLKKLKPNYWFSGILWFFQIKIF